LFSEANKQNEIIKWFILEFNCAFNRYIFRTLLSHKSISTHINNKGNISYECILKHRKYRSDSLVSFFIYRESWRGHCPWIVLIQNNFYVLRDIIIYHLTFLWFLFNGFFLMLILQVSLLSYWSLPPIVVDTISRM
jgi:hypothetical protein